MITEAQKNLQEKLAMDLGNESMESIIKAFSSDGNEDDKYIFAFFKPTNAIARYHYEGAINSKAKNKAWGFAKRFITMQRKKLRRLEIYGEA